MSGAAPPTMACTGYYTVASVDALTTRHATVVIAWIDGGATQSKGGLRALLTPDKIAVSISRGTKAVRIGTAGVHTVGERFRPATTCRISMRADWIGRSKRAIRI